MAAGLTTDTPMFPLGTVLLPGMGLPLTVFEPRYLRMMDHVMRSDRQFGVTMIERGSEVGGNDVRASVGCFADVVHAEQFGDGRWQMLVVGTARIRVERWYPDDPYPRATVQRWPDTPETEADGQLELAPLLAAARRVIALAVELGAPGTPMVEFVGDLTEITYQVATVAPIGVLDRYRVLCAPGLTERVQILADAIAEQELLLHARLGGTIEP